MAQTIETIEQFLELAKSLPENVDRRRLAKTMGFDLPKEPVVIKPVTEQLKAAKVLKHTPKTKTAKAVERSYVEIPVVQLEENNSTRKVWVRAEIAREAFKRGLELCDEYNL